MVSANVAGASRPLPSSAGPSSSIAPASLLPAPFSGVPGADEKPRPFYNLGLSCFINASLTALFGPQAFRDTLSRIFHTDEERLRTHLWPVAVSLSGTHQESPAEPAITHEERLAITLAASLRAPTDLDPILRGRSIVPYLFTKHFYNGVQEDANEFLQTSMNDISAPRLHAQCQGMDRPILRCRDCQRERASEPEWFNWLNLSLEHDRRLHRTVQDALNAHLEPELLQDRDFQFRCTNPECQSTRLPYKTSHFNVLPQVLCIQLKRWRSHRVQDALLHDVQCDEELLCQNAVYVRRSIVCHQGSTPKSGHYTCRLHYPSRNGDWWYYNNSERRAASPAELLTTTPVRGSIERTYLAFYERK